MIASTVIIFALILTAHCGPATQKFHQTNTIERAEDGAIIGRHHSSSEEGHDTEFDHEAILGSVKDAEEFHNLNPEESKRRLGQLVKQMDLNQDGNIDRKELKAWIIRSFKSLSQEEADELFDDCDENEDGRVTWEEYLEDSYGFKSEVGLDASDKIVGDDKEIFQAADTNRDQSLDRSEFVAFNHPEEHPQMLPILLKHALRDKDTDKDGFISFEEFIGSRGESQDQEWLLTEKDRFNKDYDKNHDGLLDNGEVLSWLVPSNEEIAEDEVAHLFAASDDDHDDLLTHDEIIDHYEIFVGSEATDYGDQLSKVAHFDDEL